MRKRRTFLDHGPYTQFWYHHLSSPELDRPQWVSTPIGKPIHSHANPRHGLPTDVLSSPARRWVEGMVGGGKHSTPSLSQAKLNHHTVRSATPLLFKVLKVDQTKEARMQLFKTSNSGLSSCALLGGPEDIRCKYQNCACPQWRFLLWTYKKQKPYKQRRYV